MTAYRLNPPHLDGVLNGKHQLLHQLQRRFTSSPLLRWPPPFHRPKPWTAHGLPVDRPEIAFGAILALSWSSSVALVRRLGRLMWLLELSWELPMPLLAPTCTLTSQLGVNIGLKLPPKLIFPSIAVLPNLQNHQFSSGKPWFLLGGAVCCPIALGLLFRSSWTSLGRLWSPTWSVLGSSWTVLGASWSVLGSSWTSLEPNLEPLGRLLERLKQLLERLGLQLDLQSALQGLQDGHRSSKLVSAQPT